MKNVKQLKQKRLFIKNTIGFSQQRLNKIKRMNSYAEHLYISTNRTVENPSYSCLGTCIFRKKCGLNLVVYPAKPPS